MVKKLPKGHTASSLYHFCKCIGKLSLHSRTGQRHLKKSKSLVQKNKSHLFPLLQDFRIYRVKMLKFCKQQKSDSISTCHISDPKRRKINFIPILLLWIFWKTLTAICQKRLGNFQKVPKNFLIEHFDSSLLGYPMIGLLNYKTESNPKNIWMFINNH